MVINTAGGDAEIRDSRSLRQTAVMNRIPYYTTVAGARATVGAIEALRTGPLEVAPLQSYFDGSF
jgi:carbamoyl-phosphate synthase large subunit